MKIIFFCGLLFLISCTNGKLSTSSSPNFSEAYYFNGSNASVNISAALQGFSILTVEMFFRTSATGMQYLFSSNFSGLYILINNGVVGFSSPNSASCAGIFGVQYAIGTYNDGNVHHLAAIFNVTGTIHYLYLDGVLVKTFTSSPFSPCTFSNIFIGKDNTSTNWFNGTIDEVRISNISRYSGNFTPPKAPFTTDGNLLELLHFDNNSSGDFIYSGAFANPVNVMSVASPVQN